MRKVTGNLSAGNRNLLVKLPPKSLTVVFIESRGYAIAIAKLGQPVVLYSQPQSIRPTMNRVIDEKLF